MAALTLLAPVAAGDWTNARPLSGTSGRKVSPKVTEVIRYEILIVTQD